MGVVEGSKDGLAVASLNPVILPPTDNPAVGRVPSAAA